MEQMELFTVKKQDPKTGFRLKTIGDQVKWFLINHPKTKDNDELLMSMIWDKQLASVGKYLDPQILSNHFATGLIFKPGSIGRARRKLQEIYPYLRGDLWQKRHKAERPFVEELTEIE